MHLRSAVARPVEPLKPSHASALPPECPLIDGTLTDGVGEQSGLKREFGSTHGTPQQSTNVPPQPQEPPAHQHGPSCGHKRIRHGDHFDYIVPQPDGTAELHHPYTEPSTGEQRYVWLSVCLSACLPVCLSVYFFFSVSAAYQGAAVHARPLYPWRSTVRLYAYSTALRG